MVSLKYMMSSERSYILLLGSMSRVRTAASPSLRDRFLKSLSLAPLSPDAALTFRPYAFWLAMNSCCNTDIHKLRGLECRSCHHTPPQQQLRKGYAFHLVIATA